MDFKYRDIDEVLCGGRPLAAILQEHTDYLSTSDPARRANLDGFDLRGVRLKGVNLSDASLRGANLEMAILMEARLNDADLRNACLRNAYLEAASLQNTSLFEADLLKINLNHANLSGADLRSSDLRFASLLEANLTGSKLTGAKLFGTLRTDWVISNIQCDFVWMDREGHERLPAGKTDFTQGDFERFFSRWPSIEHAFESGLKPFDSLILQYLSYRYRHTFDHPRRYDFFVSHASEDKHDVVLPLVEELAALGHAVWYDAFVLKVGDSIRRMVDEGLKSSRYGIVILSPAFFAKEWPQYELDSLITREMEGEKVVLPIWHRVTKNEVLAYSPKLADKIALNSSTMSFREMAERLAELIPTK
ncbi:MAG: hypothetical protein QOJ64_1657 [Acidobacteriota bacterium]|jgi:hypothetical protein|nr:hypothetical protein [Acidobacteriota bacterium]